MAVVDNTSFADMMKKLYPQRRIGYMVLHSTRALTCLGDEHWPENVARMRRLQRKWYMPRFIGWRLVRREKAKQVPHTCPTCSTRNYEINYEIK